MGAPTKEAVIGTFVNGRNAQDDFLQLKSSMGGNIFAWIDYLGNLQGTFASGLPGGANTDVQFNDGGVLGGDSQFTWNKITETLALGVPTSSLSPLLQTLAGPGNAQYFTANSILTGNSTFYAASIFSEFNQGLSVGLGVIVDSSTASAPPSEADGIWILDLVQTGVLGGEITSTGVHSNVEFVGAASVGTVAGYQSSLGDFSTPTTGSIARLIGYHSEVQGIGATVQSTYHFAVFDDFSFMNTGTVFNSVFYSGAVADDGHSYAFYSKSARNYFGGTGSMATMLVNPTAATSGAPNQDSPALTLTGHIWAPTISPSNQTVSFSIQESGGFLKFTQNSTFSQVNPYSFDNNVGVAGLLEAEGGQFGFFTGGSGAVYALTSVANAVGSLTTYTGAVPAGSTIVAGQYVTIAGFSTPANNGRFIVSSSTVGIGSGTITVYNASGAAESHAATATADSSYANIGQFSLQAGNQTLFSIFGTSHQANNVFSTVPYSPFFVMTLDGNVTDAAYVRIINDGATGNHGLEIGSIIDGSGTNPVTLKLGVFNSASSAVLSAPLTLTGSTPTGAAGQLSIGTTTATFASAGANGDVPAQVVGYLVLDQGGTKIKVPYYNA